MTGLPRPASAQVLLDPTLEVHYNPRNLRREARRGRRLYAPRQQDGRSVRTLSGLRGGVGVPFPDPPRFPRLARHGFPAPEDCPLRIRFSHTIRPTVMERPHEMPARSSIRDQIASEARTWSPSAGRSPLVGGGRPTRRGKVWTPGGSEMPAGSWRSSGRSGRLDRYGDLGRVAVQRRRPVFGPFRTSSRLTLQRV